MEDEPVEVMTEVVLRTRGLQLCYGRNQVFKDINLSVPRVGITALVGPSGCGKTSFLSCLNRLVDLVPGAKVQGEVLLDGQDTLSGKVDLIALRRRVGMIFQQPNPFPMSIRKNLEVPLKEHGMRKRADREQAIEEGLTSVGLWDEVKDRLDGSALALSGGQKQRLCIARALVLKPEVLLMDEPCSALDPLATRVVENLIKGLRKRYSLVVVTHNLAQAKRIADRVAVFWPKGGVGQLVECGSANQVFEESCCPETIAYIHDSFGTRAQVAPPGSGEECC